MGMLNLSIAFRRISSNSCLKAKVKPRLLAITAIAATRLNDISMSPEVIENLLYLIE